MSEEASVVSPAEEKARAMGWVPQEEFRGDPAKWRSAEEFVQRGEQILPVMKERNDKLSAEIREMRDTMRQLHQHFQKAEVVAEQRGRAQAIMELTQAQKEAVENGDVQEWQRLEAKKIEVASQPLPQPSIQAPVPPEFLEWKRENEWYESDPEMTEYAEFIGLRLQKQGKSPDAILGEVSKKVRAQFPEKFANPRRTHPGAVEGVTPSAKKKDDRSWEALPQSAKDAYHRFAKQIPGYKKEDYLKHYRWE